MAHIFPFVRGIDFSGNDFQEGNFPKQLSNLTGLRWLRLNDSKVDWIPEEFAALNNLETLYLARNNLVTLHGELAALNALRSLICRHNKLNDEGLPADLFKGEGELSVLDFSNNNLTTTPFGLEKCKSLLVLNLSCNSIKTIPNQLFVNLIDLLYLNLSRNQLETLPPQMRRLLNLAELDLSDNPLGHNQLKLLQNLRSLRTLNLAATERTLKNMPASLYNITNLTELNLSRNDLPSVPDVIYTLKSLKRLNLSDNCIAQLAGDIDEHLPNLEVLNLSRNQLESLPQALSKLEKLRCLYLNHNQLTFDGIPNSIGKLFNLEVFMASDNNLELIPEGLFRCGKLKTLVLANNNLITLPDAIHLLNDLKVLDLANNPNLVIPPKPTELIATSTNKLYNLDMVLANQLKIIQPTTTAAVTVVAEQNSPAKDAIARKKRLVGRAKEKASESDSSKVLKGMTDLANNKTSDTYDELVNGGEHNLKPKRWEDQLERPPIDYTDFFEPEVGQYPGLIVWEIDNFAPSRLPRELYGTFYQEDCYIILSTTEEEKSKKFEWKIFYWIGLQATLDKKASAAMHAVNLRNYLSAHCRTIREEENDESEQFLELFPQKIKYHPGGRTLSGFIISEELIFCSVGLYRLHQLSQHQLYMENVALSLTSLDARFVYILDLGEKIIVWNGGKSKLTVRQKGLLLADKINKEERKNKADVILCPQGKEVDLFWDSLEIDADVAGYNYTVPQLSLDFRPLDPIIYKVCIGSGYLELPQVRYKPKPLSKKYLDTKDVYIFDCINSVYIWEGRKSSPLLKRAGSKLVQELFSTIKRPPYASVTQCCEGLEPLSFKSCFPTWEELNHVDYTRTIGSVRKIGANVDQWVNEHSKQQCDMSVLFAPPQPPMSKEESQRQADEWNEELTNIDIFVYENKKYSKLQKEEFGHFFTGNSYVFACKYMILVPMETNRPAGGDGGDDDDEVDEEEEEEFEEVTKIYFWQGRDAPRSGWSFFLFHLKPSMENIAKGHLEFEEMRQQQESIQFLSHFRRKFIIHHGSRDRPTAPLITHGPLASRIIRNEPELFHLRSNGGPLTLRTIQIPLVDEKEVVFYSAFCYILKIPPELDASDNDDDADNDYELKTKGQVFIWAGAQADEDDVEVAKQIVIETYDQQYYDTVIINEAEDDHDGDGVNRLRQFIPNLLIDNNCDFMQHLRLFRCGLHEKGYFCVSEKGPDFCQDDLGSDIMLLDNGEQVFLWFGHGDSDPLTKLEQAKKSGQLYVQSMRAKQPDRPRTLMITAKGHETIKFRKCFHAWSSFNRPRDDREVRDAQQLKEIYPKTGEWLDRLKKAELSASSTKSN